MQKRRKRPRSNVKRSFAITFSLLVIIFFGFYAYVYLNSVPVRHLPSAVPNYQAAWAKYIPKNVLLASFQNFTYLRQLNSSLPFFNTVLHLTNPRVAITSDDILLFVSMEFKVPNASVDIAYLKPAVYASFSAKFANLSSFATPFGDDTLYQVQDTATGKTVLGWLALIPSDMAVGFSPGFSQAEQAEMAALRAPGETNSTIIGLPDIRQMLYLSGGASGHISIGITGFSIEIPGSLRVLTTVDSMNGRINVSRTVQFGNFSSAYSHYSAVKDTYLSATNAIVYDAYVRASQLDALKKLGGDYRLVG